MIFSPPIEPDRKRAAPLDLPVLPRPAIDPIDIHNNMDSLVQRLSIGRMEYYYEKKISQRGICSVYSFMGHDKSRVLLKVNTTTSTLVYVEDSEYELLKRINSAGLKIIPRLRGSVTIPNTNIQATIYDSYDELLYQWLVRSTSIAEAMDKLAVLSKKYTELHSLGIVHADLNLKNIVLKGSDIHIINLERAFELGQNKNPLTQDFLHRAPEVYISANPNGFNEKIDVWSFGCLIYEMITKDRLLKSFTRNFCNTEIETFPAILSLLGRPPESIIESCKTNDEKGLSYLIGSSKNRIPIDIYDYPSTKTSLQIEWMLYRNLIRRISPEKRNITDLYNSIHQIAELLAQILQWNPQSRPSMEKIHQQLCKIDFSRLNFIALPLLNIVYDHKKDPTKNFLNINGHRYIKREPVGENEGTFYDAFTPGDHAQRVIHTVSHGQQILKNIKRVREINLMFAKTIRSEIIAIDIFNDGLISAATVYHPPFLETILNTKLSFIEKVSLANKLCSFIGSMIDARIDQGALKGLSCCVSPETKETEFRLNYYSEPKHIYISSSAPEYNAHTGVWHLGCLIYMLFTKKSILEDFTSQGDIKERSELFIKTVFGEIPIWSDMAVSSVAIYEDNNTPKNEQEIRLSFIEKITSAGEYSPNQVVHIAALLTFILQYQYDNRPLIDEILEHPIFKKQNT